jgi:hypothetical protein
MVGQEIVDAMTEAIKRILVDFSEKHKAEPLTPEFAAKMTQALREATAAAGVAGLRKFLESFEESADTLEKDGKVYRYKFDSKKEFLTMFGMMELPRRLYQPDDGGESHIPLDMAWGMEDEYATPEVREACLFGEGLNTPAEVEALFKKCALFHPSASTIKRLAKDVHGWLEENKEEVDEAIRQEEEKPARAEVLVGSLDGVNVLLDEPGKRKGRPTERPKKDPEEDKTSYRNAMVGSVSLYAREKDQEGQWTPERLTSRYVARMPEANAPTVKAEWEQELWHAESLLGDDATKLLLLDASRGLWNYVESKEQFDDYEKVVDFFHTTEHLSSAAEALFGKKSEEGKEWYEKHRARLLQEDNAGQSILRSMDYYRQKTKLSQARRAQLLVERTFFQCNKHRMPYAALLKRGLPIGNGIVEAGCKSLVKQRLGRSGMRWSRQGGQAILNLRTYIKSNRWDLFWKHYNQLRKVS